jgi:hypothetical protein
MMSNLTPTQIVDKNGKTTTVHKNLDKGASDAVNRVAGVTPSTSSVESSGGPYEQVLSAINKGDEKFSLAYVNYDDKLMDGQIESYLSGTIDDVIEEIDNVFSDSVYEAAVDIAKEKLAAVDIEWDDLEPEDQDELRFAIMDKDESNPVNDLVRNTPSQLMRAVLGDNMSGEAVDYAANHDTSDFETGDENTFGGEDFVSTVQWGRNDRASEARIKVLQDILGDRGFDVTSKEALDNLAELVDNGPYDWHEGVSAEIIWYGDISDANVGEWVDGEQKDERRLEFGDSAHVLLIDKYNGSGHEVEFSGGGINTTINKDNPAVLDSKAVGYGWDEVAGVHKPAYAANVDSTWT